MATAADLRAALARRLPDEAVNVALAEFATHARALVAEAQADPASHSRCKCGRATIGSERNGRITALGSLAEDLGRMSTK